MVKKQKTVVVTGASQGIGTAIANLFLERGYNVVANSRRGWSVRCHGTHSRGEDVSSQQLAHFPIYGNEIAEIPI
jgi:NAD(P)-dependent dehydrogenase (short-subunit alcohol dehydrogenase family)